MKEDIFFIVQGNKETSDKYVKDIAKELITVLTYYLGELMKYFKDILELILECLLFYEKLKFKG